MAIDSLSKSMAELGTPWIIEPGYPLSIMHAGKVSVSKQVGLHQCRVYTPCIELTPEQRDLSEAEESYETSGTKGCGVHPYLRVPRQSPTLDHRCL